MRYFAGKVSGDLFIHAEDVIKCEEYIRALIAESGLFNVEITLKEVPEPLTLHQLSNIYEEYELDIQEL